MKIVYICLILLLILFVQAVLLLGEDNGLIFVESESHTDEQNNVEDFNVPSKIFKATKEWQEIGNSILPKGLHVRINIQTGKKEAKLLEDLSEMDVHSRITSNYQVIREKDNNKIYESIKSLSDLNSNNKINKIEEKLRTIEDLKQSNIHFTTESVLLKQLWEKYFKETETQKRCDILNNIEDFVHSIDLANDFYKMNGFDLLLKHLNETDTALKLAVLNVFGASIQNNLQLKNDLLKSDFIRQIILIINNSKDLSILKKSLFVLSTFLRNFPDAQKSFFHSFNGIVIIESLLKKDLSLALKTSTLLSDLTIEILTNPDSKEVDKTLFETIFQDSTICLRLIQLFPQTNIRADLISLFESMFGLTSICQAQFRSNVDVFQTLLLQLNQENDEFIIEVFSKLLSKILKNSKDEL